MWLPLSRVGVHWRFNNYNHAQAIYIYIAEAKKEQKCAYDMLITYNNYQEPHDDLANKDHSYHKLDYKYNLLSALQINLHDTRNNNHIHT